MTDKIEDGGPAFPHSVAVGPAGDLFSSDYLTPSGHQAGGMSLRDWFAGQALMGMLANPLVRGELAEDRQVAKAAYAYADAMLRERSKHRSAS